jgi:polysaccharide biosynthesis protein PslG
VALTLFVVLLLAGGPTPPNYIPNPPLAVQSQQPITCMHTRLDGEVTDAAVYRTLTLVREMGAPAIVEFFYWAYIEPTPGNFDWSQPDRIINMARGQGLTVIARLGVVPAWARPDPALQATSLNSLSSDYFDEYAAFVGAFAARYAGIVDQIIPWNEPNLAFEWGYRQVLPSQYVELLRQVHQAAHAGNPNVQILGGALAPTLENSANAQSDLGYLRGIYQAGGAAYFDALAVHTYGFTLPPEDPPHPNALNFRRYELLRQVMQSYGDADTPVYITETGWNDHPRWVHAVRPGRRLVYTLEALQYAATAWPEVRNLCFWFFRAPTLYRTYQDYFAFVTVEFRAKPIYQEVQAWARGWPATGELPNE